MTVIAGAAPCTGDDLDRLIPINQRGYHLAAAGDEPGLRELLSPVADGMMADPLAGFKGLIPHHLLRDAARRDRDTRRRAIEGEYPGPATTEEAPPCR